MQADTDTGLRMIRGQRAYSYGSSYDGDWVYVDAPAGRGWVSKAYIAEGMSESTIDANPAWPPVPIGSGQILAQFGQPGNPLCYAGRVVLPGAIDLSWEPVSVNKFVCHKLVEDVLSSVFYAIYNHGLWDQLYAFGGCYNYRPVSGSAKISTHAWGIAVDLNPLANPVGATPEMHPKIVGIFKDHGFVWGGDWSRPDGMHFQYARGY